MERDWERVNRGLQCPKSHRCGSMTSGRRRSRTQFCVVIVVAIRRSWRRTCIQWRSGSTAMGIRGLLDGSNDHSMQAGWRLAKGISSRIGPALP